MTIKDQDASLFPRSSGPIDEMHEVCGHTKQHAGALHHVMCAAMAAAPAVPGPAAGL
jgi:hypothetical protein